MLNDLLNLSYEVNNNSNIMINVHMMQKHNFIKDYEMLFGFRDEAWHALFQLMQESK